MAERYESIKLIGDRLLRSEVFKGITLDYIIDCVIDFIDIVGAPAIYMDKLYQSPINNYRAPLPCDFVNDVQVMFSKAGQTTNGSFFPATHATDTFHQHYDKTKYSNVTYTYTISNSYIFTSIERGHVQMVYKAIMTDAQGYPMLPDSRIFINALEWFIKYKYFTILWENGKIEDKRLENAKQEYAWAVGQLQNDMVGLSLSKAETLLNSFKTLIPRENEFAHRFANTGAKEFIKVQ